MATLTPIYYVPAGDFRREISDEVRQVVREELTLFNEKQKRAQGEKLLTINAVARRLGRHNATIKRYVQAGLIRTVPGGSIPESAITEFLNNQNPATR